MDCFPQRFLELDEGDLPKFNINFFEKLKKVQEILKFCKLIKTNQLRVVESWSRQLTF